MFYFVEFFQLTVVHYINKRFSARDWLLFLFTIITLWYLTMKLRRIYDEVMKNLRS